MRTSVAKLVASAAFALIAACGRMEQSSRARPGDGAVIYQSTVLTMDSRRPAAEAVIVRDGAVLDLGSIDNLVQAYSGASFDERFLRKTLMPAFVDARELKDRSHLIEVDCNAENKIDEIAGIVVEAWASKRVVRIAASRPGALKYAVQTIEAASGISEGRGSVEFRGVIDEGDSLRVNAAGAALILSGEQPLEDCVNAPPPEEWTAANRAPALSGRIAVAAAAGQGNLLDAASEHLTSPTANRLSPQEALEAITTDSAFALGAEAERGVIAPGRRADFAVLDRNPLATPGEAWGAIGVERF